MIGIRWHNAWHTGVLVSGNESCEPLHVYLTIHEIVLPLSISCGCPPWIILLLVGCEGWM